MADLKTIIQRLYRVSLNYEKQEKLVWEDLKKLHLEADWRAGVFEKEKYIETVFQIDENVPATYYYMIYRDKFLAKTKVLDSFMPETATELFVLASHFNNLLNNGVVSVNVENNFVEYHCSSQLLLPLLYPSELYETISNHYNTSRKVHWAFQKLMKSNEPPALIIAELLEKDEAEENVE